MKMMNLFRKSGLVMLSLFMPLFALAANTNTPAPAPQAGKFSGWVKSFTDNTFDVVTVIYVVGIIAGIVILIIGLLGMRNKQQQGGNPVVAILVGMCLLSIGSIMLIGQDGLGLSNGENRGNKVLDIDDSKKKTGEATSAASQ